MYASSNVSALAPSRTLSDHSAATSKRHLINHPKSFHMTPLDARSEKGLKSAEAQGNAFITELPPQEYQGATRAANAKNPSTAFFDALLAVLALYFAAFAFLALHQNNTLAHVSLNQVLLKLSDYNPTIFPILFTLIFARFLKTCASFMLERGATVGMIQHLLSSRTFATSILAPIRFGTMSLTVLAVLLFWCLSPIGGQISLRTASRQSNYTTVARNFHYLDLNQSSFQLLSAPSRLASINAAYATSLFSSASSPNATQDVFGNIRVPMLEVLRDSQIPDSQGWFRTAQFSQSLDSFEEFLGIPGDSLSEISAPDSVYVSLTGIPFVRGGPVMLPGPGVDSNQSDEIETTLGAIDATWFGSHVEDIVKSESQFNMETSYFSLNCTTRSGGRTGQTDDFPTGINPRSGVVSNNRQFVISYDFNHTINSTEPRRIQLTSWGGHQGGSGEITKSVCNLTTTYVEASVYCANGNNCSVQAIRPSTLDHNPPVLSQLDGITPPFPNASWTDRRDIADHFFAALITATGNSTQDGGALSPTECYFVHPENPYQCSLDNTAYNLYDIGDALFSRRFTQILNTYWTDSVAQYSATGNYTLHNIHEQSVSATTPGKIRIETKVLRCHIPFMVVLVTLSFALFAIGMVTAYLGWNRRGPDIIDDFVSSLGHNPYVHVEQGLSMEDGHETARRLRGTVIRLGDVQPDDTVGLVAIGTPTQNQSVRMLQLDRQYR